MATLTLKQGESISRTITIKDSAGAAVNITSGIVKVKICRNLTDTNASAVHAAGNTTSPFNLYITLTTPASGIATWTVPATITDDWVAGSYFWEVEFIDSVTTVSRTATGVCEITKSIFNNG